MEKVPIHVAHASALAGNLPAASNLVLHPLLI